MQIIHIICSSKNNIKSPNFNITEKLLIQGIKSTFLTITIQDREILKKEESLHIKHLIMNQGQSQIKI